MDTTKIEKLKFQVEQLNNLISSKANATTELEKMSKIYNDAKKAKEALESLTAEEVNATELQEYVNKEKESLAMINEYAGQFSQMNSEIAMFDEFKAGRVNEFLTTVNEQKRLVTEIRTAEKLSDKSKGPKVLVYSAEGRKKMIDADLVEDYKRLAEEKRQNNRAMVSEYKKVNNITSVKKEEIIKPIEVKVEVAVAQITEAPKTEVDVWNSLTTSEKASELAQRRERILEASKKPGMGKKRLMIIDGQKVEMPVSLIGVYNQTSIELSGQKNKLKEESDLRLQQAISEADASRDRANARDQVSNDAANIMRRQIKLATVSNEIVEVKKPKTNMYNKIKNRVVEAVVAAVLVVVIATSAIMSVVNAYNDKYKGEMDYVPKASDQVKENTSEAPVSEVEKEASKIVENEAVSRAGEIEKPAVEVEVEAPKEKMTAELGDTITIKDGGRIYTTAEDAKNGTNEFTPYFGTEVEREVRGIYYTLKDGRTYLALSESENKPTDEQLKEAGAIKSSYLTGVKGSEQGYEGYFGVDSVVTVAKEVENGRSR